MKKVFSNPIFWYGTMLVSTINIIVGATYGFHHMLTIGSTVFVISGILMVVFS